MEKVNFKDHLLNVNISVTVGQIFTKFGNFIENRHIFTQLNVIAQSVLILKIFKHA